MKREAGFYWVLYGESWIVGEWWEGLYWFLPGCADQFKDADFEVINENKITQP